MADSGNGRSIEIASLRDRYAAWMGMKYVRKRICGRVAESKISGNGWLARSKAIKRQAYQKQGGKILWQW